MIADEKVAGIFMLIRINMANVAAASFVLTVGRGSGIILISSVVV